MDTEIIVKGLDELIAKLGRLAAFQNLRQPMADSLNKLWDKVAKYPTPPEPGSFRGFVSAKQRRYFFYALRAGLIQVPYRRTGTLGRRWTMQITQGAESITGILGNNTTYGPWVQDKTQQATIHQGRWPTAQDVLEKQRAWIVNRFNQAIEKLLR